MFYSLKVTLALNTGKGVRVKKLRGSTSLAFSNSMSKDIPTRMMTCSFRDIFSPRHLLVPLPKGKNAEYMHENENYRINTLTSLGLPCLQFFRIEVFRSEF